jgi:hypothetical protein
MKKSLIISIFISCTSAFASQIDLQSFSTTLDYAQVTWVTASESADGSWCFNTRVRHNDQGWDHYADGWEVVDQNANQLGVRELAHPHDNEQPFTRSQCNIQIHKDLSKVVVRAKCNQHGFGGKAILVDLNTRKGEGYSIKRAN